MHLEDNYWLKGMVDDKVSNVLRKIGGEKQETPDLPIPGIKDNAPLPNLNIAAAAQQEQQPEDQKEDEGLSKAVVPINLGKRALFKIMGP